MVVKSVLGVIFDRNSVLLIQRRDVPVWVLPGGGIEEGESGEDAIVREVKEEIGVDVQVVRKVGSYTGGFFIKPVHLYECTIIRGAIKAGDEALDAKYFPLDALPKEIPPPFHEFIQDALDRKMPFEREITSITLFTIVKTVATHPILFIRFILSRIGFHINS